MVVTIFRTSGNASEAPLVITLYDHIYQLERPLIAGAMAERHQLGNRRSHRLPILLFVTVNNFVCHARIHTHTQRPWSNAHRHGPLVYVPFTLCIHPRRI